MINVNLEVITKVSKNGNPYNVYSYSFVCSDCPLSLTILDFNQVILFNEVVENVSLENVDNHLVINPIGFKVPWKYEVAIKRLFEHKHNII